LGEFTVFAAKLEAAGDDKALRHEDSPKTQSRLALKHRKPISQLCA
jgi:hypothetical protein